MEALTVQVPFPKKKRRRGRACYSLLDHSHNLLSKSVIRPVNAVWSLRVLYCQGVIHSRLPRTKNVCLCSLWMTSEYLQHK